MYMYMYFSIALNKHCTFPVIYVTSVYYRENKYLGAMTDSSMITKIDV